MKTILQHFGLFLACMLLGMQSLTADGLQCRHGISWTVSQNKAWGFAQPVITNVKPNSAAFAAGLRPADIIEEIDGFPTRALSPQQIQQLLAEGHRLHTLKISNLGYNNKKLILALQCKPCNSFTERELAELFSLYSIEDANLQHIHYPYHYTQNANFPLLDAKTFGFAPSDSKTADTDSRINQQVEQQLLNKGLSKSELPDLVLSSYYHLEPLPVLREDEQNVSAFSWRYHAASKTLRPLPVHDPRQLPSDNAKYRLVLGLQIQSRQTGEQVWTCEATEYLSEGISIADYAETAIATMLLGFPYVKEFNAPRLAAHTLCYNYTGIIYAQQSLNIVVGVEDNSPAMRAGLRPGDRILSINGQQLDVEDTSSLLAKYFKLTEYLARYRDKDLLPLQAHVGGIPATYWRLDSYDTIARQLERDSNNTAFAYLFAFRPYILGEGGKLIIYEILRDGQKYFVPIAPEYRNETTISQS